LATVLVFCLDELRLALSVAAIERVVRAVHATALPGAPDTVRGIINVHGRILPVVSLRARFRLPERATSPTAWLVLARTPRRSVALIVDTVVDVAQVADEEIVPSAEILPGIEQIDGVVKLRDELILIQDLHRLLSLEEEHVLDRAMSAQGERLA
jgi:purine-binding chemotaxis protein CheW